MLVLILRSVEDIRDALRWFTCEKEVEEVTKVSPSDGNGEKMATLVPLYTVAGDSVRLANLTGRQPLSGTTKVRASNRLLLSSKPSFGSTTPAEPIVTQGRILTRN